MWTNSDEWKMSFFAKLDDKYGIKDQGRLHSYLGVQVELTEEGAFLHQKNYEGVLRTFGFCRCEWLQITTIPTMKVRAMKEADNVTGLHKWL